MSQVWEGRTLNVPFLRFRNPYKKHWSQVWESGIPIENLGLESGGVCSLRECFFRFRNPYKKHWSQVWESGIPIENLGLKSKSLECWKFGRLEACYVEEDGYVGMLLGMVGW